MRDSIKVGTRASVLARTQSQMVADALGEPAELVFISTEGDVNMAPLERIGGTGVFVSAVRDALVDRRIDLAVHSMKDLPTAASPGIALAACPLREDPRDALCARDGLTLETLPPGALVGTGSPRRVAQLLALRPDLRVVGLRGNIDTRLGRVGELDAVVLATAGLTRAGRTGAITEVLDPEVMLPAPAQGALAVECRADETDQRPARLAGALHDPLTHACVVAERQFLATLEAGCTAPVGGLATVTGSVLTLRGLAISPDGRRRCAGEISSSVESAAAAGVDLACQLLAKGAAELIAAR